MRPRSPVPDGPLRVLFVCTANISRSPYAERQAALLSATASTDPLRTASAGVPGFPGRGMDPAMAEELRARGGDPLGHVSRCLTREILDGADVVLTFEFAQRIRIVERWPDQAIKVFGLHQFTEALGRVGSQARGLTLLDEVYGTARPDGINHDVADPYRRGAAAARVCADEVDAALAVIVPALTAPAPAAR